MSMIILKKEFDAPEINLSEIKRYMKVKSSSNEFDDLIFQCLNEVNPLLRYSVCYSISKVAVCDDNVLFDNITFKSEALSKVLEFCDRAVIFSATVGLGVDRMIAKYSRISPSKALCMHAVGAERIESLCDSFCEYITSEHGDITHRFSPGYGDFNIASQRIILNILDSAKLIGLTLNDSFIMTPTKSVTAIAGIRRKD